MKVATTIQISQEEDREITRLKNSLGLPSKKTVVMEGIRALRKILQEQNRRRELQSASRLIRQDSLQMNREWASKSSALRAR